MFKVYSLRGARERFGRSRKFRVRPPSTKKRVVLSSGNLEEMTNVLFLKQKFDDNTKVAVKQRRYMFAGKFSVNRRFEELAELLGLAVTGMKTEQILYGSYYKNRTYIKYDVVVPADNGKEHLLLGEVKQRYRRCEIL